METEKEFHIEFKTFVDTCKMSEEPATKIINSPTKSKLLKIINKKNQQIHRLKRGINPKKKKHHNLQQAINTLHKALPAHIVKFVESQMKVSSAKVPKGRRYSNETKTFALTLYHISEKAYKLVSSLFCLPSKSSLRKWVSKMPNTPGLTKTALDVIAKKVATMSNQAKKCIISFDEMALKTHLFYQSKTDELVGLEDYGNGTKTNNLATSAIVFMARGLIDNWKQPLAYFLVNESCSSDKVHEKLVEVIDKVEGIGLDVAAVVCDIGSNFQKLQREMGVTPEKPWFIHNRKKIFYIIDPPHIIKAVRNNLMKHNFHFEDKVASWKDVITLYDLDTKNPIRCCPKLTKQHIAPNNFEKMRVKLATQVMSHTVSSAMLMAISGNVLPAYAAGTAEFLARFDEIFDCLNSSSFKSQKPRNRPITSKSDHCQFMDQMCSFVKSLKVRDVVTGKDVTNTLKCLKALEMTLNATTMLWRSLESSCSSIKFLCTRRLNQDPLENFFGSIRQQGGNCGSPTPIQFTRSFRKLFFDNYLHPSNGNCTVDLDTILLSCSEVNEAPHQGNNKVVDLLPKPFDVPDVDYQVPAVEENMMSTNAITYVAGYLLKKCIDQHPCDICKQELVQTELNSADQLFCQFKAYNSNECTGPFGSLIVPVPAFVEYISNCENIFVEAFGSPITTSTGIGKSVVKTLKKFKHGSCAGFPVSFLCKLFVRMRIYYSVKFANQEIKKSNRKGSKRNKKYLRVTHL